MMKTKHTPWRVEDITLIVNSDDNIIARLNFESSDTFSETKANAKLIAAAPEMLFALDAVEATLLDMMGIDDTRNLFSQKELLKLVQNAIEKATK